MSHTRELAERYRLEKILKSSRSGTVLRATDAANGRPVVVKLIPLGTAADAEARRERFLKLAMALRQPVHPSLPRALDAGFTPDGEAFLALERLEGRSLAEWSGAAPGRVLTLLEQVAAGLDALAARGLAHANLAPENVFVIPSSQGERAKLLGLGTALFRRSHATVPPEIARFQPPEGEAAGWRGDLWAFATTAAAVLGIQVPPPGAPEPAVTLPLGLTFELEDADALRLLLERCLRADPAARPASWQQVRDAIGLALGRTFAVVRPAEAAPQPQSTPVPPAQPRPVLAAVSRPAPPSPPPLRAVADGAAIPAAAPVVEPEPVRAIADGSSELLTPVTDELLDRLTAPEPTPAEAAPEVPTAPPPRRRRFALVAGVAGMALVVAAGLAWWLVAGRSMAPPPAVFPAARPERPSVPASERLATARELVAQGLDDQARELLAGLTPADQATLAPADCALYAALQETLARATIDRLATDLPAGLREGSLAALLPLVRTVHEQGASVAGLYSGAEVDFATAARLVELHDAAEAAAGGGDHAVVLARFAALRELFPRQRDAFDLRDRAAEAIVDDAEAIARRGDYDTAAARLEIVATAWPDRPGLAERLRAMRGFASAEPEQLALLEKLPQLERRRRPDEALTALREVEPIPHLEARFAEATKRFAAQLTELDKNPPVVELRNEDALQYDRGTYANLSFRVQDDYEVKDVTVMARREGGRAQELSYERDRFGYTIEIPPSFHQNGTIEVFITATDLSGHEGRLGSRDQPLRITRAGGFERLLRN